MSTSETKKVQSSAVTSDQARLAPLATLSGGYMPAERYQGRLELTWTNKDLRLLAEEDGSYTWVPPADYRVAEVRLLHSARSFGAVGSERSRAHDNLLIQG